MAKDILPGKQGHVGGLGVEHDKQHGQNSVFVVGVGSDGMEAVAKNRREKDHLKQGHGTDPAAGQQKGQLDGEQCLQDRMPIVVLIGQRLLVLIQGIGGETYGVIDQILDQKQDQRNDEK